MNRRFLPVVFVAIIVIVVAGATTFGQVTTSQQTSDDKSATHVEVTLSTMDRTVVPLVTDAKQTKVDADTTRQASVTQVRSSDGSYKELSRSSSVMRKTGANTTETSTEIVERDREGQAHTTRKIAETTTKTSTGEQSRAVEYRRDSSGNMVLAGQTTRQSTKNAEGSVSIVRVAQSAGPSGGFSTLWRTEETVTPHGDNQQTITRTTTAPGVNGAFSTVSQETETVTTQGNTTRRETVVTEPGHGGAIPTSKIVQVETRGADGSSHMQRDIYRRDVNGDWKPVTFSTETGSTDERKTGGN